MRRLESLAVWWTILFGFSLLVLGVLDRQELIFGAAAAVLGAIAAEAIRTQGLLRFRFELGRLLRIWRPLAQVVPDFVLVTVLLARSLGRRRAVRGRFRAIRIAAGGTDAQGAGRRAWIAAGGSIAPNTLVLDVDPDEKVVLVHQLDATRSPGLPE